MITLKFCVNVRVEVMIFGYVTATRRAWYSFIITLELETRIDIIYGFIIASNISRKVTTVTMQNAFSYIKVDTNEFTQLSK